jgi:hypothetical protein
VTRPEPGSLSLPAHDKLMAATLATLLARPASSLLVICLGLLLSVPSALAQSVVNGQTETGVSVSCLGAPMRNSNGSVAVCILARDMDFTNYYGTSPSGQGAAWSMDWPRCKAGESVSFGTRGNVVTCTLHTNVSVTNGYGVSPSGQGAAWSFGFTCRKDGVIAIDPINGHVESCISAGNQSVNNTPCKDGALIDVAKNGAVTCGGGSPAAPAALTGTWSMAFIYNGQSYPYRLDLRQSTQGGLTGTGSYPASGQPAFAWTLTGSVTGTALEFTARYTLGVTATMKVTGTVEPNGTMKGTWSDDVGGGRRGTWTARR